MKDSSTLPQRYLVTAALPYANGPIHIGQIAGAYLPPDIYVRYLRSMGRDVLFVCGSDEHGAAITLKARKEGISPKEIIDKYHQINQKAFEGLGVSFDVYHRTSAELHHETASEVFKTLEAKGAFIEEESEQYYDESYKQFLADRYIVGTCPKCGNENAYGDQCERCGSTLSPTELINPRSTLSGETPVLKKTSHWYFPLDQHQDWLRKWILEGEGLSEPWKKNVLGQVRSWLDDGLRPRAITRDLDWGVKVPLEGAEGKVLYVWLDAPFGYVSATRQWAADHGKDWEPYWKDAGTKMLHFIGKDNIVFHCIIFPALLKVHGDFILPTNVPANEFMNMEGDKLSTSRNWAVWIPEYLEKHAGRIDLLRYVLCANAPETKDSEFTWKDWQNRNNNELVATFGNFVNRVMVLSRKYYDGKSPAFDFNASMKAAQAEADAIDGNQLYADLEKLLNQVSDYIEQYRFRDAQNALMDIARYGNGLLAFNEPWKLIKQDEAATAQVMAAALQICEVLSIACEPFLPESSAKLRRMLSKDAVQSSDWSALVDKIQSREILHKADIQLGEVEMLFDKIDDKVVQEELDKLEAIKKENAAQSSEANYEPLKEEIQYEDFSKLDLRTATILKAEKMPKADKLLVFEVDLGFEKRTIVSGIAKHFDAEDLIGQRVLVLANLAPRKLRGTTSEGMILLAEDGEGKLSFVSPPDEEAPDGSPVN
jgi:methionyl-tRNA synthetase